MPSNTTIIAVVLGIMLLMGVTMLVAGSIIDVQAHGWPQYESGMFR